MGTLERIEHVADRITKTRKTGTDIVVVVSAMAGETDKLLKMACRLSKNPARREIDLLLSSGERISAALLTIALQTRGIPALSMTGRQIGLQTDSPHPRARIKNIDAKRARKMLKENHVIVVAGFQGINPEGDVTTLGRGGSDTSAVALAVALGAKQCEICTDVDGVYTSDPRMVPQARKLDVVSYDEMLEMASLGSKVLQIRAVEFAGKYAVPLRVLHSFKEGPGTLITLEDNVSMEQPVISGIAFNRDEAKLTIRGVPDTPGVAFKILGPVSAANIEVDMIVQNVSMDNTTDFTFTVHRNEFRKAESILKQVASDIGAREVAADDKIAKVSIVGVGMRSHAGVASSMFEALADEGINIQMISTSEIKVSVVIDEKYLELAVRALHTAFGLDAPAAEDA